MERSIKKACGDVVLLCMEGVRGVGFVKKATKYISPEVRVTATRKRKPRKNEPTHELVVTIGRPNFKQRAFVKKCKNAYEPFPIKKIQLEFFK